MFRFRIGQHVWFLVGPMSDDEDPEYLEGDITKRYIDDEWHGSPDGIYEIQTSAGVYERDEGDLYASFDELRAAVDEDLEYWVGIAGQRIKETAEELAEAHVDKAAAEKRLRDWNRRCRKVGSHAT